MVSILLLAALLCPKTHMQNITKQPWTKYDYSMLDRATLRCGELYPDAPCVKLFRKFNFQSYSVICGGGKK